MDRVALVSMALTAAIPLLLWRVERELKRREVEGARPPLPPEAAVPASPEATS
jgi:hypothetical protein